MRARAKRLDKLRGIEIEIKIGGEKGRIKEGKKNKKKQNKTKMVQTRRGIGWRIER